MKRINGEAFRRGDAGRGVARLGVADVRTFGLTWEDCEQLLKQLSYSAHIHIEAS